MPTNRNNTHLIDTWRLASIGLPLSADPGLRRHEHQFLRGRRTLAHRTTEPQLGAIVVTVRSARTAADARIGSGGDEAVASVWWWAVCRLAVSRR
jgi:hypothetical protein